MGNCRHSIGGASRQVTVFTPLAGYEGSVFTLFACELGYEQFRADKESLITQPVSRCPPVRQALVAVECSFAR